MFSLNSTVKVRGGKISCFLAEVTKNSTLGALLLTPTKNGLHKVKNKHQGNLQDKGLKLSRSANCSSGIAESPEKLTHRGHYLLTHLHVSIQGTPDAPIHPPGWGAALLPLPTTAGFF